jgi:hypothetical protein
MGEFYTCLLSIIVTGKTEKGTSHANKEASGTKHLEAKIKIY